MNEIGRRFLQDLLDDLEHHRLVLPTLPEVALRIRDVADDENASIADLTRIIATDAALSARLIQVANSPLMRGTRTVESVDSAVARLGMKLVRDLATSIVVEQTFQPTSDLTDRKLHQLWQHSVAVAAIAHVLASQFTRLAPEQAMLAGLVHDIGALPILTKVEDYPELLEDEAAVDAVLHELHPRVGAAILASWNFSPELVQAVAEHENLMRDVPEVDYGDVVMVANLQSYIGSDHRLARCDWSQIPAFARLGLSPEVNVIEIEETAEDIRETQRLLGG